LKTKKYRTNIEAADDVLTWLLLRYTSLWHLILV